MPVKDVDERLTKMRAFVADEHFRYRRFAVDAGENEFTVTAGTSLVVEAPPTPLVEQMVADFRTFLARCMNISPAAEGEGGIRLRLRKRCAAAYDVMDPAGEAFALNVSAEGVTIEADHERGVLHGTHYLEHLMSDRGGPFVPYGHEERMPRFMPRITSEMHVEPLQRDAYLSLLSHFGANGVRYRVNIHAYGRSHIFPELDTPDYEERISRLQANVVLLRKHGIDHYLFLDNPPIPAVHPVFQADPSRRGAPYRVFDDMAQQYVLCSGNEEVLAYYDERIEQIYSAIPGLGGAIILVGGEGFMHCYSRPYGKFTGYSSCPHCGQHEPSLAVANLVNRLAAAVKRTGRQQAVFSWPYSAFTWSGEDRAQLQWIAHLNEDVSVLSNFDTGSPNTTNNAGVYLYDYNIMSVGPSEVFRAQAQKSTEMGRRIYAKTESNTTPSAYFTAYIPVPFRWHQRFLEMAKVGVAGYMNQWGFYGSHGSPPEELQYHAIWNHEESVEALLFRMATRDFGVPAAAAKQVVSAWRKLSGAWDDFPYSAMTAGEREFYSRGPLHYGPSHPLIFNEQNNYKLSPKFRGLSGDLKSLATPEELAELMRDAKPRYVCDLLLTLPYGVERYLELITRCRARWLTGLVELKQAIGNQPTVRAQMELDVCETFEIHLATIEHVVRFYAAREKLWRTPADLPAFREIMAELGMILQAEIANAERSLPILARDFRIRPYDAEMVLEKIRQCRYVLENELPLFDVTVRFHVWNSFP